MSLIELNFTVSGSCRKFGMNFYNLIMKGLPFSQYTAKDKARFYLRDDIKGVEFC